MVILTNSLLDTIAQGEGGKGILGRDRAVTWRTPMDNNLVILDRFMSLTHDVTSVNSTTGVWDIIKTFTLPPNTRFDIFPDSTPDPLEPLKTGDLGQGIFVSVSLDFAANANAKDARIQFGFTAGLVTLVTLGAGSPNGGGALIELGIVKAGVDKFNSWAIVTYAGILAKLDFFEPQQQVGIVFGNEYKIEVQTNAPIAGSDVIMKDFRVRLLK